MRAGNFVGASTAERGLDGWRVQLVEEHGAYRRAPERLLVVAAPGARLTERAASVLVAGSIGLVGLVITSCSWLPLALTGIPVVMAGVAGVVFGLASFGRSSSPLELRVSATSLEVRRHGGARSHPPLDHVEVVRRGVGRDVETMLVGRVLGREVFAHGPLEPRVAETVRGLVAEHLGLARDAAR